MKNRMRKLFRGRYGVIAGFLLVAMVAALIIPFTSRAELVDVYIKSSENEHLRLEWTRLYDKTLSQGPEPSGKMNSQASGKYQMQTDSWGAWFEADACDYAYTSADYNAGSDSVMTIQVTVDELKSHKQFGIMIRESLKATSKFVWLNFDSNQARMDYRDKSESANWTKTSYATLVNEQQVHLKVVLQKSRGVVEFYIKNGGDATEDEGWNKLISKGASFLKTATSLYTGIVMATDGGVMGTATFSNFSVKLQAPEGYEIEGGSGTGSPGDEGTGGEDTGDKLPEDLAAAGDALLYETFTDGIMFPGEEDISVTNPLWYVRSGEPIVKTNEAGNNRFIATDILDEPLFIETGDMEWTDYSVSAEIVFPETVLQTELNRIRLMVRQRTTPVGGVGHYGITLYNRFDANGMFVGQYLDLDQKQGPTNKWVEQSQYKVLETVLLSDTQMLTVNETHTIKVDVFDNTITVYLDDMSAPKITYTDNRTGGHELTNEPYLVGGVGFIVEGATVQIDNLTVRKLLDPLGGDWDNRVMGDYDKPVPEWIEEKFKE